MRSVLPRVAIAVVAIALVAWSAVLWRGERIGSAATDRILRNPDLADAAWEHEIERLRDAELFDPSTQWQVNRAAALLQRGRIGEARRVIEEVVESEPDNLEAWLVLRAVARGRDPARAAQAEAEVRRLNPRPGER
jgi:predicted Zn-dependent protease